MKQDSGTGVEPSPSERTASPASRTVVVSGASGLVGSALIPALASGGFRVLRLVRRPVRDPTREVYWDPAASKIDADSLLGVEAVVNLAGSSIAGRRWSDAVKREIRESRVRGTGLIAEALAGLGSSRPVLINASAIGFYGDRGVEPLDESSGAGEGFLAQTVVEWEAATAAAKLGGCRVVLLRTGVVLSASGGALAKMLTPFRLGIGGRLGSGRQMVSWISLEDLAQAIVFAISEPGLSGPVNAVGPAPVSNAELTRTLGRLLNRPAVLPLPEFAIELMFGEMGRELLLSSAYVIPRRLESAGFRFRHATVRDALAAALGAGS